MHRAIRKYGQNAFTIEELLYCKLEATNMFEIQIIKEYNSTNKKIGYNISAGGGSLNCVVSEEIRKKLSKVHNSGNDLNINNFKYKGEITGYRVHRIENGIHYYKGFASSEHSLEENYNLAMEWLESLKSGTLQNKKYIKESALPKNITYKRIDGEIKGYRVNVRIKGKLYSKDFISNKNTMEEKLNQSIKFKESILEGYNN